MAENTPEVDAFIKKAMALIEAATSISAGKPSEDEMAMLKQVQTVISALQSALNALSAQQR